MNHPKMQAHPKMRYTYVGVDSHKATHTAVFLDCFFEKSGEITFANLPSDFPAFLAKADKLKLAGTTLLFGLEDTSSYGRLLAMFLLENGQKVKHVNAFLVARERKAQTTTQKTDSVDAECAARVLLSKFGDLPDADPQEKYWILRTLVVRRDFIVKNNISLKNHLHSLLTQHYPNYRKFFTETFGKTAMVFFERFPSPSTLKDVTVQELAVFFSGLSYGRLGTARAEEILGSLQDTTVPFQEIRDEAVRSTLRQVEANFDEIKKMDTTIAQFLEHFDCTLTTMPGLDTVSAAQMLSCIGDIKRFSTSAKLARYSGIAPVTYASGQKDQQFANQRGNRELNASFHLLAVRLIGTIGVNKKVTSPHFYAYYHRKLSEGKTKMQALKCVQRRLVNIIWGMLTHSKPYKMPEMIDKPEEEMIQ